MRYLSLFTGANLKGCNMDDPHGNKALMEGVNLKGTFNSN